MEVDGCIYTSPSTFSLRKTIEQDVAKLALGHISKKIKDEGCPHICVDKIFCKFILNEFAIKTNEEKPTYNTAQPESKGFLLVFSSLDFNGISYTDGHSGNQKEVEQLAALEVIISLLGIFFLYDYYEIFFKLFMPLSLFSLRNYLCLLCAKFGKID